MGLFQRIKDSLLRRRLRESPFRPYIRDDLVEHVVDQMAKGELPGIETVKREVEFILIRVREGSFDDMKVMTARVLEAARVYRTYIDVINLAYIRISFDPYRIEKPPLLARADFLRGIRPEFGGDVAILHGRCEAFIGDLGTPMRCVFGTHLPHEQQLVRTLMAMSIGEERELNL